MAKIKTQTQIDADKLLDVVESCKTIEQAKSAYNYYKLWEKKYEFWNVTRNGNFMYVNGYVVGWFNGFLSGQETSSTNRS